MTLQQECMTAMNKAGFSYYRKIKSCIWAAKRNHCPICKAVPGSHCLNMTEVKRGRNKPTKWPHNDRVDWQKLHDALKDKGYIK